MDNAQVHVGGMSMAIDEARAFVHGYLTSTPARWAYPAYDGYPGTPGDTLGPQDLFAPELLNAGLTLRSYYAFLAVMDEVNSRLSEVPVDVDLSRARHPTTDRPSRRCARSTSSAGGSGAPRPEATRLTAGRWIAAVRGERGTADAPSSRG